LGPRANLLPGNERIDAVRKGLNEAFGRGLEDAGFGPALDKFNRQTGQLATQLNRIKESDPVKGLTERFEGLEAGLAGIFDNLKTAAAGIFDPLTASADSANADVAGAFQQMAETVQVVLSNLRGVAVTALTAIGVEFRTTFQGLAPVLTAAFTAINSTLTPLLLTIGTAFNSLFGPEGSIALGIQGLFGEEGLLGAQGAVVTQLTLLQEAITPVLESILTNFTTLTFGVAAAGLDFAATLTSALETPVKTTVDNIKMLLTDLVGAFSKFAGDDLASALSTLAANLQAVLVTPVVGAMNAVIEALEQTVRNVWEQLGPVVREASRQLGIDLATFTIARLAVPGAQAGALRASGLHMVGEGGPELINVGRPSTIFPNAATQALESLAYAVPALLRADMSNQGGSTVSNRSVTNNFYNQTGAGSLLMARHLEALQ
jgi:phage-related protein